MPTPHDILFQFTFSHAHHAAAWVKSVLPTALAQAFDPASLRPIRERFPGVRTRPHRPDGGFVATFRFGGQVGEHFSEHTGELTVEALMLTEHKSFDDPDVRPQVLRYSVYMQRALQKGARDLTLVLPIVLQHGRQRRSDAAEKPPMTPPMQGPLQALHDMQPQQQMLVDDLDSQSEEQILARGLTPLATLTLLCLRTLPHTAAEDVPATLFRWQHLLRAVDRVDGPPEAPPLGDDAIDAIGWYVVAVTEVESLRLAETLAQILYRDVHSIMSTLENTFQKGRRQGKAEGQAETLLRQIARRFGPPTDALVERVRTASHDDLDRWTDRILDAASLDELFAD